MLGWGLGSLGSSTLHNGIAFLALYYMSQVLAIPPALAGSLLLMAKVYDIVTDPLMGWLSDRVPTPWGRRRPWLLAGAFAGGLAFVLFFNPPGAGALVTCGAAKIVSGSIASVSDRFLISERREGRENWQFYLPGLEPMSHEPPTLIHYYPPVHRHP